MGKQGVAPIYEYYPLSLRLHNTQAGTVLVTEADIRNWMPDDNLYNDAVFVPRDLPPGEYELELALISPLKVLDGVHEPAVKLAIDVRTADGWYTLVSITVK